MIELCPGPMRYLFVGGVRTNLNVVGLGDLPIFPNVNRSKEIDVGEWREHSFAYVRGKVDYAFRSIRIHNVNPIF